jgi:glyoxylate reductase
MLGPLAGEHDLDVWPDSADGPSYEELGEHAQQAEGLLTMLSDRVDAALIESCPRLRAISNFAVGVDNVDLEVATARGIPVGNTPRVLDETTADMALALMLAVARRIVELDPEVRAGRWPRYEPLPPYLGHDLNGSTLGIVGLGRIGSAVARRAAGFDMSVLHTSHSSGLPLDELLERSDFVSLHTPLTPGTRGLIGERELRLMKQSAILVNTARGPIVDQDALRRALEEGWIAGAGLDVTDPEPLPGGDPLLRAPNLVVVPHVASATHRTRWAIGRLAVENLAAALRGERMAACANPDVYVRGPG